MCCMHYILSLNGPKYLKSVVEILLNHAFAQIQNCGKNYFFRIFYFARKSRIIYFTLLTQRQRMRPLERYFQ
jgi:hypothetical protein